MIGALLMALVIAAVVVVVGFLVNQKLRKRFTDEVIDFLAKAREAESKMQGIAIFMPRDRKEIHFFEKMTDLGYTVRNPLSTGGYAIADSQKALWNMDANIRAGDVVHVRESATEESRVS